MSLIQAARLQRLRALRSANLVAARSYATPVEFSEGTADPQLNGYPQLPVSSAQRLPAKGWWDVQDRRNFGDFVHEQNEALSMWTPDVADIAPSTALKQLSFAVLGFVTFGLVVKATVPARPSVPREYPFSGLVNELGGLEENKAVAESIEGED